MKMERNDRKMLLVALLFLSVFLIIFGAILFGLGLLVVTGVCAISIDAYDKVPKPRFRRESVPFRDDTVGMMINEGFVFNTDSGKWEDPPTEEIMIKEPDQIQEEEIQGW